MKELLKAMGICILEKAGYEADDILGTIAKQAEKEEIEVSLVFHSTCFPFYDIHCKICMKIPINNIMCIKNRIIPLV